MKQRLIAALILAGFGSVGALLSAQRSRDRTLGRHMGNRGRGGSRSGCGQGQPGRGGGRPAFKDQTLAPDRPYEHRRAPRACRADQCLRDAAAAARRRARQPPGQGRRHCRRLGSSPDLRRGADDDDPAGRGDRQRRCQPGMPAMGDLAIDLYLPGNTAPIAIAADDAHRRATDQFHLVDGKSSGHERASWRHHDARRGFSLASSKSRLRPKPARSSPSAIRSRTATTPRPTPTTAGPIISPSDCLMARARTGVLNLGIDGNRVLIDGIAGVSGLARFDRDVLAASRGDTRVRPRGINDMGISSRFQRRLASDAEPSSSPATVS